MARIAHAVSATLIILAFGLMPLAADWCAASCDAHSAAAAVPACHHAASAGVRIGQASRGCGHDHKAIVVNPTVVPEASRPATAMTVALAYEPSPTDQLILNADWIVRPEQPPLTASIPLALSSTLRI
jgi:hypothetical protein